MKGVGHGERYLSALTPRASGRAQAASRTTGPHHFFRRASVVLRPLATARAGKNRAPHRRCAVADAIPDPARTLPETTSRHSQTGGYHGTENHTGTAYRGTARRAFGIDGHQRTGRDCPRPEPLSEPAHGHRMDRSAANAAAALSGTAERRCRASLRCHRSYTPGMERQEGVGVAGRKRDDGSQRQAGSALCLTGRLRSRLGAGGALGQDRSFCTMPLRVMLPKYLSAHLFCRFCAWCTTIPHVSIFLYPSDFDDISYAPQIRFRIERHDAACGARKVCP